MADNAYTQAINNALASAKGMLGKNEVPNRAEIQSYLRDGGEDLDPHKVAWCAAFVSASLQKAGLPVPTQVIKGSAFGPGAYAPNYLTYGSAVDPKNVQAGDILVANNGTHVGFAEGPTRQGPNGPEVQLLAGNEPDVSGQYAPGSYTSPTGAVAKRSQVGQVGERWVPLSQYSARRYEPTDSQSASPAPSQPMGTTINSTAPQPSAGPSLPTEAPNAGVYSDTINAAAKKYNIDPVWFTRLIQAESNFDPKARSPAGAQGIAQFMPATAKRYGVDVNDPNSSIEGAAHYLSDNIKLFNGNVGLAVAGYNWGEGNVQKWLQGGWNVPKETTAYVNKVTGHSMDEWKGAPATAASSPPPSAPAGALAGGGSILPGFSDAKTSDKFQKDLQTAFGQPDSGKDDQTPRAPQPMALMRDARNTSPLGGAMLPMSSQLQAQITGYQPQAYGHTLTSIADPTQWGSAPPGSMPGAQTGQQAPAGAASPYGTSLAGLQMAYGLSPQQLQMMLSPMMLNQGGSFG